MSRSLLRRVATGALAGGAMLAVATPAQAAELTLNYKCEYPLIGKRLLTVEIDADIPDAWPSGVPTDAWDVSAKATAKENTLLGLELVSATTVEGTALAKSTVAVPAPGGGIAPLPANVQVTIPPTPAVADENGDLVIVASGMTPELTFPAAGTGRVTVDGIQLNLIARKADGSAVTTFSQIQPGMATDLDPDTFDVYCELDPPTQSTVLKDLPIELCSSATPPPPGDVSAFCTPAGPFPPTNLLATSVTDTSARVSWTVSSGAEGPAASYHVYLNGEKVADVDGTSIDLTDLDPSTEYDVSVRAVDDLGNVSDPATLAFLTASSDIVPPTQPGPATVSSLTATTAKLCWGPSTDNVGVIAYDVFNGATKLATVTSSSWSEDACADLVGLTPDTTYNLRIVARDAAGAVSAPREVSFRTAAAQPTVIPYSYDLKGSTVLRTLTAGTLPLSGSLDAKLTLETQKFEADLKLNATKGNLKALGFLPVRATVSFTNAAKTTGSVGAGGAVTSNSKVNIRLSSVNVFGIPLVAGNCRTQKPSEINLKSAAGFDLLTGGTLTGSYAISNLIDCGPLTVLVSPLTAGSGNTISVNLTKQ